MLSSPPFMLSSPPFMLSSAVCAQCRLCSVRFFLCFRPKFCVLCSKCTETCTRASFSVYRGTEIRDQIVQRPMAPTLGAPSCINSTDLGGILGFRDSQLQFWISQDVGVLMQVPGGSHAGSQAIWQRLCALGARSGSKASHPLGFRDFKIWSTTFEARMLGSAVSPDRISALLPLEWVAADPKIPFGGTLQAPAFLPRTGCCKSQNPEG